MEALAPPTADGALPGDRYRKATAACRHEGGISNAAKTILDEDLAPGTEDVFEIILEECWQKDEAESVAAAAAVVGADRGLIATGCGSADQNPATLVEAIKQWNGLFFGCIR